MKRIIRPFVLLLSALFLTVSCMSDDDDFADITFYSDTAITSFSLGTLNRTMWTKSSTGEDSSYVAELQGSNYKFYIDQINRKIYNPDSLPKGTDAAHVICSVTSKNSGTIVIKNVDSDTLNYYDSEDSIDFTQPREFRVYALDGSAYRAYTVSVNVHKEDPDSLNWHDTGVCPDFTSMTGMKAVAVGGRLTVLGCVGGATVAYSRPTAEGAAWSRLTTNVALDAGAYSNLTEYAGTMYTVSGGSVLASVDGATWNVVCAQGPARLLGAGRKKMYGLGQDGRPVVSEDGGATWTADGIVGDAANLPSQDFSLACLPLDTDDEAEYVIMTGNRDVAACPDDSVAMVWNKVEEYSDGSQPHSWMYCNERNNHELPRLSNLTVVAYGDVLLAVGGRGQGTSTAAAFSQAYVSEDNGLTWHKNGSYYLPEGFTNGGSDVFALAVDDDDYMWLVAGGTGDVWRGRLNRLGWEDWQTSFTE